MRSRLIAAALAAALVGCGAQGVGSGVNAIQPRDGKSGLQLSGTIDGRQFAVNDGAPLLRVGDCDVNDGQDVDLCFFTKDIDGGYFAIIIENPDAVRAATLPVVDPPCRSPHCEDVTDGIVAELQFAPGAARTRVTGGQAVLSTVNRGAQYSGRITLTWPQGNLAGSLEVVPRPDPEEAGAS